MSMPGSIDPPGQAQGQAQGQAPIIMNQESLRYLGAVIAESVSKSQDVVKPTKFKGGNVKDPEKLFVFIYEMEEYAEARNISLGGSELTRLCAKYLTGEALIWYKASQFKFDRYPWNKFCDTLKDRYLDARFEAQQLRNLTHGIQKRDVKSYSDDFIQRARYVRSEWKDPTLLKEFYYSGLKPEIKASLVTEAADDRYGLDDLMLKAQQIDEIRYKEGRRNQSPSHKDRNQFRSNFKGGNRSGGEERGVDADGDIIMANLMQSKKLSWTERKFLKQNNACYTCYRVGHKSFDCPYRKDNKKNPPKQTNKSDLN